MREHADHHDAELMLRLYELRREEKLRRARDWFIREFHADSVEDFEKRYPDGSEENTYYRMTVSYWEMAASIVNHGLIHEELFFENNQELWTVWTKIKDLVAKRREIYKNPYLCRNLETLADKYEKWMATRAPEFIPLFRERIKTLLGEKRGRAESGD